LNGGNTIGAINSWAVSLVRNTAGTINWRKDEIEALDGKSLTMYYSQEQMLIAYIPERK